MFVELVFDNATWLILILASLLKCMSGQFGGPMETLEAVLAVVLDFAVEAVPGGEGDEAAHATSAPLMLGPAEFGEARIAALARPLAQI